MDDKSLETEEIEELRKKCDELRPVLKRAREEFVDAMSEYDRIKNEFDAKKTRCDETNDELEKYEARLKVLSCTARWRRLLEAPGGDAEWPDFWRRYRGTELAKAKQVPLPRTISYQEYDDYMHLTEEELRKLLTFAIENEFETRTEPSDPDLASVRFKKEIRGHKPWKEFEKLWEDFRREEDFPALVIGWAPDVVFTIGLFRSYRFSASENEGMFEHFRRRNSRREK